MLSGWHVVSIALKGHTVSSSAPTARDTCLPLQQAKDQSAEMKLQGRATSNIIEKTGGGCLDGTTESSGFVSKKEAPGLSLSEKCLPHPGSPSLNQQHVVTFQIHRVGKSMLYTELEIISIFFLPISRIQNFEG